jgi:hypothetical protein
LVAFVAGFWGFSLPPFIFAPFRPERLVGSLPAWGLNYAEACLLTLLRVFNGSRRPAIGWRELLLPANRNFTFEISLFPAATSPLAATPSACLPTPKSALRARDLHWPSQMETTT